MGRPPGADELLAKAVKFLQNALPAKSLPPGQHDARGAISLPLEGLRWSQWVEKACCALASCLDQAVEEFGDPPDEDEAVCLVKECADDVAYSDCDTRALLLLALEDYGFAECEPDNYEALQAEHENTLTAEYLIGENVYLALLDELEVYLGGTWLPAYWKARGD